MYIQSINHNIFSSKIVLCFSIQANKTLIVKERRFPVTVSTQHLAMRSPVFEAMFERYEGKERRRERNQRHRIERAFRRIFAGPFAQRAMPSKSYYLLEINDILSIFSQFIASNVLAICELAFQVDTLLRKCERILRNCFEIPFADRFLFADKYSLKGLMVSFCQYNLQYIYIQYATSVALA